MKGEEAGQLHNRVILILFAGEKKWTEKKWKVNQEEIYKLLYNVLVEGINQHQ